MELRRGDLVKEKKGLISWPIVGVVSWLEV